MKEYIDAKCNVFIEYMQVPDHLQGEFENLCAEMHALGDGMTDYNLFEQQFASSGLSDRYNTLLAKCTPKAVTMTVEQKQASFNMAKEQISVKDIAADIVDMATTELQQEAISMKRKAMIDAGAFDEYTRTSNKIDDATRAGKFLLNKFKKK